jgi:hypothetical protein
MRPGDKQVPAWLCERGATGRPAAINPRAYIDHFRPNVLPKLETLEGFRGASLLEQGRSDTAQFL